MEIKQETVEIKKEEIAVVPPKEESEVDYEAELLAKDEELKQVRIERENYRKGMLKAKGKLPDEDEEKEDLETLIDRKVQEKFLLTKEAQIQAQKDDLTKNALKKVKELTTALKNRSQITSTTAPGSNQDKPEVKVDSYFSNDQIQALKAKGWSDEKIEKAKKNMLRGNQVSK